MKNVILAFLLLIITVAVFGIYQKISSQSVRIKNHELQLLIAKSDKDKQLGLSTYDNLAKDKAMVFIFDNPGIYSFWMKDMKFPLDIIFINGNKIVTIYSEVPNPKGSNQDLLIYSPTEPANRVLEINSGLSKKYDFKVGDKVEFNNLK